MNVHHPGYPERVYAGVLGKIIGVYVGRPFEQRSHAWIDQNLGEITEYVHERMGQPLIVTDDDISGTFGFLRAYEDYGPDVTPEQIGETWLNQIIEGKTILWWGGMGSSTEHTAFLRLKKGIKAPESGSIASNGQIVAEQIGAQIFIDGWGLLNPGDPERAADYARRAASVSHDGVAIHGAQMVAAMVAAAFVEPDIDRLIDIALGQIPHDSWLRTVVRHVREWRAARLDWRAGFALLDEHYGYAKFGGGCHMVPNHALIIHALLHSGGSLDEALKVVNSCGMDTDCNSGNVGCIMAVRGGLAAIDARWREPVADRLFIPTAEGGRCVTDAVQIADWVVRLARGKTGPGGAKFHFRFPGSVQGFQSSEGVRLRNVGQALGMSGTGRAWTSTYPQREERAQGGYGLVASPTLYSGQSLRARLHEGAAVLYLAVDRGSEDLDTIDGPALKLGQETEWTVPDSGPYPIVRVGLLIEGEAVLDWLTWEGEPDLQLNRGEGTAWRLPWAQACDGFESWDEPFRLTQNEGVGLLSTGTRDWRDIDVSSRIRFSLIERGGLAVRVQGLRRYYALELVRGGRIRLIRQTHDLQVLAERDVAWELEEEHELRLVANGPRLTGFLDELLVLEADDDCLDCGGAGFVVSEGRLNAHEMRVRCART